jgi:hypothetical protein
MTLEMPAQLLERLVIALSQRNGITAATYGSLCPGLWRL